MATGWVKSMQCKYAAIDDVVHRHHHRYHRHESHSNHHHHRYHRHESDSKHHHHNHTTTTSSTSCRKSVENLKGIIETTKQIKKSKQPPPPPPPVSRIRHNPPPPPPLTVTPALTELSEGHQSRNVVEIIFHTGWSPKAFMGRMEMVFKVQNANRTVTRFEEYRDSVKSRADTAGGSGSEDLSRCIADGNEMMRFQCLGPTNGGPVCDAGGAWGINAIKGAAICTFSGSGGAHDAAGGGKGRRAMLVCRVIAGRVCKRLGLDSLLEDRVGFDSVSREDDELLVFDSRAVLPCFLIIYKL